MAMMTKSEARALLEVPAGGRYVSLSGWISSRKGAKALIRAFAEAPLKADDRLLFAGPIDAEIREFLRQPESTGLARAGRLIAIGRLLPEDLLDASVAAADLVALPYLDGPSHSGPSNIAIRAARCGRPILATPFPWAAAIIPKFKLGNLVTSTEPGTLGQALVASLNAAETYSPSPAGRNLADFFSMENFQACWTARLAERLGRPVPPRIGWDAVWAGTP